MALYSIYRNRKVLTDFEVRRSESLEVNPRADHFSKRSMQLSDFFHPFFVPYEKVKFEDCDLFGPAVIVIWGGSLDHVTLVECDTVVIRNDKPGVPCRTGMVFKDCIFHRVKIYRALIVMNQVQLEKFKKAGAIDEMNIISGV